MTARVERLGLVAALVVVLLSALTLASWFFDEWRALAFGPHYVPMPPVSAVLFAALAATLLARRWAPEHGATRGLGRASVALGVAVASLVLLQARFGFALPWDQWLVSGIALIAPGIPAGRMSPTTAVAFLLSSLALAAGQRPGDAGARTVALSAGASLLIGLGVTAGYVVDAPLDYGFGRVPMALLSAVSCVLLNASLLMQDRVIALARKQLGLGDELSGPADRSFAVRLAAILLALLVLIGFAGLSFVRDQLDQVRNAVWRELDVVADQKAQELGQWREERLAEGRFLQQAPQISRDIKDFLARPDDAAARTRVVGWLEPIRGGDRYLEALLFDAEGNLRLAIPASTRDARERIQPPSAQPPFLGPIRRNGQSGPIRLDLHVPLADPRPLGAIVLRVDPARHLYPLIERWNTRLRTAEATLARREGDQVVYLHDLRHRPNSGLRLSFPVTSPHLPAAMAARGELGTREGIDYRGEPVISSARIVPGSPWLLVAKIDQSEAYAPLRIEAWRSGLLLALILFSMSLAAAYLWRERHAATIARSLAVGKELRESEERHRLLADNATDVIWTTDAEGRFTYVSPSIQKRRGFTPAEVMSQDFAASLTPASALIAGARYRELKEGIAAGRPFEPFTLEVEQICKDGSTAWSEVSVSGIVDAEGRFVGALGVSRDIGERRRTQERLAAQLDELLRWQAAMLNREGRVLELKREVNELSLRLGREAPYASHEQTAVGDRADVDL